MKRLSALLVSVLAAGLPASVSAQAPVEIDAIGKLMAEPGIAQSMRGSSSTASR